MTVGERIRYCRISKSLTQKALAKLAGISEIAIRKYESGDRIPKTAQLQQIAKAMGLPITRLLDVESPEVDLETVGDFMKLFYVLEEKCGFKLEYDVDENNMVLLESVRIKVENQTIHYALARVAVSDHIQKDKLEKGVKYSRELSDPAILDYQITLGNQIADLTRNCMGNCDVTIEDDEE